MQKLGGYPESGLDGLREELDKEVSQELREISSKTNMRLECTLWTLDNETEAVERRLDRLDKRLTGIKVPGEDR